jgi:hypothetical protein
MYPLVSIAFDDYRVPRGVSLTGTFMVGGPAPPRSSRVPPSEDPDFRVQLQMIRPTNTSVKISAISFYRVCNNRGNLHGLTDFARETRDGPLVMHDCVVIFQTGIGGPSDMGEVEEPF